ncbi:MAG: oligosaccharide flippase family protein [Ruminococcus flavefaciens]|nr:oligosaccharide flippase family protein [Ruminococcus flavefaciens]MCM1362124.1 oligosaccharide flippase family protein [Clostridiales bacterium]MCM1435429.1 oligosaccharide flippase family protein [Ruminococcus flavefaciens]
MSRGGKLAKNTIILAIGTFLPKLASFITLPILTGKLTKESYGTYDLIVVLVSLFLPAVTLQIQTAAFRFLIDIRDKKDKVKSIITNITAFIIPVSIIALLILYFCLYKIDFEVRILICLYYFLDIFGNSSRQIVRGLSENLKYSLSAIINSVAQLVFVVVFVWYFEIGLLGGVLALAVAELISVLYLFFSAKIYKFLDFKMISIKEIKRMLAYSWPMVPNSMSMWVMRVSDRLVITFFMNVSANAVYAVANKIPQLLTLAQTTFTMAWQENASIVSKDEDADRYYSDMYKTMFDLMAGAMCMIIAFVPLLFIILVRGDYSEAYNQIPILLLGMFFYAMSAYLGGIYVAYMKTKSVGITTMIAAVLNVVIDVALIHFIGLYAASLSTLISYVFLFFYRLIDVRKIIKIQYDLKHMILVFVFMTLVSILCVLQNSIVSIFNFLLATVVFLALNRQFLTLVFNMIKKKVAKK